MHRVNMVTCEERWHFEAERMSSIYNETRSRLSDNHVHLGHRSNLSEVEPVAAMEGTLAITGIFTLKVCLEEADCGLDRVEGRTGGYRMWSYVYSSLICVDGFVKNI